jgi:hypothetical protein
MVIIYMETATSKSGLDNGRYKKGAQVCLVLLALYIVWQLVDIYRIRYQLDSPLIPKSTIGLINKQFLFRAAVASGAGMVGLSLYFTKKYLVVIILVIVTLIVERYIYI